jgi:hypothetical protein
MYFLGKSWRKQAPLWNLVEKDRLEIHTSTTAETRRIRVLMEKYQDAPMDLADASLVATAETRELRRVFTLDSHFRIYRANDKESFDVVPWKLSKQPLLLITFQPFRFLVHLGNVIAGEINHFRAREKPR